MQAQVSRPASYVSAISADMQTLGSRLRAARQNLGLSQVELAARIEVTPQTVSQWEADIKAPSRANLQKLSARLNIDFAYLVFGPQHAVQSTALQNHAGEVNVGDSAVRGRIVPVLRPEDVVTHEHQPAEQGRIGVFFDAGPDAFAVAITTNDNVPVLAKGDLAVFSSTTDPVPGDVVLAGAGSPPRPVVGTLRFETLAAGVVTIVQPVDTKWPAARSDHGPLEVHAVLIGSQRKHHRPE